MMGDYEFLKFLVCAMNGWNPYAEDVRMLPDAYWLLSFQFVKVKLRKIWDNLYEPSSELVGYLTHPEIYKIYADHKAKKKQLEETGRARIGDAEYIQANAKYIPKVGIVDLNTNKVLIPEDKMKKST